MKKGRMKIAATLLILCFLTACGTKQAVKEDAITNIEQLASESAAERGSHMDSEGGHLSGTVPEELEYIPEGYRQPSEHPGTLEKLTYHTWESFSYEEQTQELTIGDLAAFPWEASIHGVPSGMRWIISATLCQ